MWVAKRWSTIEKRVGVIKEVNRLVQKFRIEDNPLLASISTINQRFSNITNHIEFCGIQNAS